MYGGGEKKSTDEGLTLQTPSNTSWQDYSENHPPTPTRNRNSNSNNFTIDSTTIKYYGTYSGVEVNGTIGIKKTDDSVLTFTINSVADMIALSYMVNERSWYFGEFIDFSTTGTSNRNKHYLKSIFNLTTDLDFKKAVLDEDNEDTKSIVENFNPIGGGLSSVKWANFHTRLYGTFKGNNHTISNLTIDKTYDEDRKGVGLFGHVENFTVEDITLDNANIKVSATNGSTVEGIAALIGRAIVSSDGNNNCTTNGCCVKNSSIVANGEDDSQAINVGVICGGSYKVGTVEGSYKITIDNCTSDSNYVYGTDDVGGIIGNSNDGNVSLSNNTCSNSVIIATNSGAGIISGTNTSITNTQTETNNTDIVAQGVGTNSASAVYLHTNKWNLVGYIANTFAVFNNNEPPTETTNGMNSTDVYDENYGHCDFAAIDFVYGTNEDYDDANNWNTNYLNVNNSMEAGKGYFIWPFNENYYTTPVVPNVNSSYITKISSGLNFITNNVSFSLTNYGVANTSNETNNGTTARWFALGNPFDKNLDVTKLVGNNDPAISNTQGEKVYIYDATNDSWITNRTVVYPGEGFMVASSNTDGSSSQTTVNLSYSNNTVNGKSIAKTMEDNIVFNCYANGTNSKMYAKQLSSAQDRFDKTDAFALFSYNENRVEPYFVVQNRWVIYNNYLSDNYVCDISFHAVKASSAKLSVKNVPQGRIVSIIDLTTNTETILDDSTAFVFDVEVGENAGRYKIKITKDEVSIADIEQSDDVNIWSNKGKIYVSGKDLKLVEVMNTFSQSIYKQQVSGNEHNFNLNCEGVFVVRVKSTSGFKSKKIVIIK